MGFYSLSSFEGFLKSEDRTSPFFGIVRRFLYAEIEKRSRVRWL
jgi:hypothetical protein